MTLDELKVKYVKAPKMLEAINAAIKDHGGETQATTTSGQPSHRKGSNCELAARYHGWTDYDVYAGARAGKARTEGYVCVIVPSKPKN